MKKKLTPYGIYTKIIKELNATEHVNVLDMKYHMDYGAVEFTIKNDGGRYGVQISSTCENSIIGVVTIEYYDNTEACWFDVTSYFIDTHTVPEQLVSKIINVINNQGGEIK